MKAKLFIIIFFSGCTSFDKISREVRHETKKYNRTPILEALKKDSIQRLLVLNMNERFYYIEGPSNPKSSKQSFYAGTYIENNDTLYLDFYKNHEPTQMSTYLLKDTSDEYLIYPYKFDKKSVFLKIRRK